MGRKAHTVMVYKKESQSSMRMIVKNFALPADMIDGLEKLAKREDKPVSRIVRAALADHLQKAKS